MEKPEYYLKRTSDRINQAGKRLDEIIENHNRIAVLLQDAVNFFRLASGAVNVTLCDKCPLEATAEIEGKHFCDKHLDEFQKQNKEKSDKIK
jgi:hypothetical protein